MAPAPLGSFVESFRKKEDDEVSNVSWQPASGHGDQEGLEEIPVEEIHPEENAAENEEEYYDDAEMQDGQQPTCEEGEEEEQKGDDEVKDEDYEDKEAEPEEEKHGSKRPYGDDEKGNHTWKYRNKGKGNNKWNSYKGYSKKGKGKGKGKKWHHGGYHGWGSKGWHRGWEGGDKGNGMFRADNSGGYYLPNQQGYVDSSGVFHPSLDGVIDTNSPNVPYLGLIWCWINFWWIICTPWAAVISTYTIMRGTQLFKHHHFWTMPLNIWLRPGEGLKGKTRVRAGQKEQIKRANNAQREEAKAQADHQRELSLRLAVLAEKALDKLPSQVDGKKDEWNNWNWWYHFVCLYVLLIGYQQVMGEILWWRPHGRATADTQYAMDEIGGHPQNQVQSSFDSATVCV